MPPAVTTSSPTLSSFSISATRRCCWRCGRMSRKYMKTNIARRMRKKPLPTRNLLAWHCGGFLEAVERRRLVCVELAPLDRRPRSGCQVEQKSNVVLGQKYQAEELLLVDQMAYVSTAEPAAGRAGAVLVERARIAREAGVAEIEATFPRERGARPPEACREDAVEHVDPAGDDLEDAGRVADAHEVAGASACGGGGRPRRRVEDEGAPPPPPP